MTIDQVRQRVQEIMARAEAHSALRRSMGLCCECDEPLAGEGYAFGDDYCVAHARDLELECLIEDQRGDQEESLDAS